METHWLTRLPDRDLLDHLIATVTRECRATAHALAVLAEVDARMLYADLGYPSMHAFCVDKLHFSDDAAYRRINAARTARRCPGVFAAVADGRLHLTAVLLLGPYLSSENAEELIAAATHKSRKDVEAIIADRFPKLDLPSLVAPIAAPNANADLTSLAPARVMSSAAQASAPAPRVEPLAPERYALQLTMSQRMHDKLRQAQELMSHTSIDVAEVLERALDVLIAKLEKQKFAATDKPRASTGECAGRTIPADVKREVWERDGGQCTFVSDDAHRCTARTLLEFDHIQPFVRGGDSTVENLRLRCRTHNQLAAEQASDGSSWSGSARRRRRPLPRRTWSHGCVSSASGSIRHVAPRSMSNRSQTRHSKYA